MSKQNQENKKDTAGNRPGECCCTLKDMPETGDEITKCCESVGEESGCFAMMKAVMTQVCCKSEGEENV